MSHLGLDREGVRPFQRYPDSRDHERKGSPDCRPRVILYGAKGFDVDIVSLALCRSIQNHFLYSADFKMMFEQLESVD